MDVGSLGGVGVGSDALGVLGRLELRSAPGVAGGLRHRCHPLWLASISSQALVQAVTLLLTGLKRVLPNGSLIRT